MKSKEIIITIIIAVVVGAFYWAIPPIEITDFLFGKHFTISMTTSFENSTQYQNIVIKNIKAVDATNVDINLISGGPLTKISDTCTYAQITSGYSNIAMLIHFKKIPSNYECNVNLSTSVDNQITYGTITADGLRTAEKWDSSEDNSPYLRIFMLEVIVGAGVIIVMLVRYHRDSEKIILLEFLDHTVLDYDKLREKYGLGFIEDDKLIIEAIKKGKITDIEISVFTRLNRRFVKKRLKFMSEKGIFILE